MIEVSEGTFLCPETKSIFSTRGLADSFALAERPVLIEGDIEVAPWGANNDLPQQIIAKSEANEIVSSNLLFNIESAYGMGIKPFIRNKDGSLSECVDDEVLQFFEDNDVSGFFLEQITDMMTFFNPFPQIILSGDRKKIVRLHHLEAAFSRWGSMKPGDTEITKHYYSALWGSDKRVDKEHLAISNVLSRYSTFEALNKQIANTKENRFVLQVSMPTPGRSYYANAYWHSIFRSGWYDLSCMIPKNKVAILKNNLTIRNIVYISDKYWEGIFKRENISANDHQKKKEIVTRELEHIKSFISGDNGKGGTLITSKETYANSAGKATEDRQIIIEPIKSEMNGGELVQDSEEASNIISYAMGVHPSLNGATPGKNSGSLGGSDKETLFAMKQAMMQPFRDQLLKPLNLIKRFNGWNKDLVFAVPEHQFFKSQTPNQNADS